MTHPSPLIDKKNLAEIFNHHHVRCEAHGYALKRARAALLKLTK